MIISRSPLINRLKVDAKGKIVHKYKFSFSSTLNDFTYYYHMNKNARKLKTNSKTTRIQLVGRLSFIDKVSPVHRGNDTKLFRRPFFNWNHWKKLEMEKALEKSEYSVLFKRVLWLSDISKDFYLDYLEISQVLMKKRNDPWSDKPWKPHPKLGRGLL